MQADLLFYAELTIDMQQQVILFGDRNNREEQMRSTLPPAGLEPAAYRLEGGCSIH